ncbi:hypothetical protein HRR83_001835 [Exophiala dermatitidis]|uniref:Uncharacterized protein n=1 Tax=Exophiala dermatitidis TaxID=5970 RepID=A0AAN6F2D8_EXODE|nr:hypothetical protein HRR73_004966 [Exophiala dermatitidis]KAJ4526638.1 hypothetical protein HRR74_001838 [Exophiala dermatitidis]KAJ4532114.1 hypothetical protein HRR76_007113 [Exophiala dermatitidis]KAJ4546149.1 hypothetical protein HRR77_004686 [Exophiala dermatitidis]KAJ4567605.1 hypothetical protein HRR79_005118 [Exophiala dermatitidis]
MGLYRLHIPAAAPKGPWRDTVLFDSGKILIGNTNTTVQEPHSFRSWRPPSAGGVPKDASASLVELTIPTKLSSKSSVPSPAPSMAWPFGPWHTLVIRSPFVECLSPVSW